MAIGQLSTKSARGLKLQVSGKPLINGMITALLRSMVEKLYRS